MEKRAEEIATVLACSNEELKAVSSLTEYGNDFDQIVDRIISDDEKAVDSEGIDNLADIRKMGCFSDTKGFMRIYGCFDNTLFARMYVDAGNIRHFEYCQMYADGRVSPKIKIPQAGLLFAASYNFDVGAIKETGQKRKVSNFVAQVIDDYLNYTEGVGYAEDFKDFFNILINIRDTLPVFCEIPEKESPEEFYVNLIGAIRRNPMAILDEHKAYYALNEEQIMLLAKELNIRKDDFLKHLKAEGFLYLTSSSKGYKTNVRMKPDGEFHQEPYTEWCYCILKLEYLAQKSKELNYTANR